MNREDLCNEISELTSKIKCKMVHGKGTLDDYKLIFQDNNNLLQFDTISENFSILEKIVSDVRIDYEINIKMCDLEKLRCFLTKVQKFLINLETLSIRINVKTNIHNKLPLDRINDICDMLTNLLKDKDGDFCVCTCTNDDIRNTQLNINSFGTKQQSIDHIICMLKNTYGYDKCC